MVGAIEKVGAPDLGWQVGQRVGVGWHAGHCGCCPACRCGAFSDCEKALTTGLSTDGGYAERMIARAEVLAAIPDELASAAAAPLLCAGRTTFGALQNSGARRPRRAISSASSAWAACSKTSGSWPHRWGSRAT